MFTSILKRLLFVSIVLASKYHEDYRLKNSDFAKIGGISKEELMFLEINFLKSQLQSLESSVSAASEAYQ